VLFTEVAPVKSSTWNTRNVGNLTRRSVVSQFIAASEVGSRFIGTGSCYDLKLTRIGSAGFIALNTNDKSPVVPTPGHLLSASCLQLAREKGVPEIVYHRFVLRVLMYPTISDERHARPLPTIFVSTINCHGSPLCCQDVIVTGTAFRCYRDKQGLQLAKPCRRHSYKDGFFHI
jgi:hypothetical protein